MPPDFWLPQPPDITFVVLSVVAITSYILALRDRRIARQYIWELDSLKRKHHSDEDDNILKKPMISPTQAATTNKEANKNGNCSKR